MIFEWLKRIFKKWLWALGFLPALLDYISAYIPQDNIPPQVIEYLSKGGNWAFSLALFTFLLVVSSYLVFSEEKKDSENQIKKLREQVSKLQNEIDGFHNSKPVVTIQV